MQDPSQYDPEKIGIVVDATLDAFEAEGATERLDIIRGKLNGGDQLLAQPDPGRRGWIVLSVGGVAINTVPEYQLLSSDNAGSN